MEEEEFSATFFIDSKKRMEGMQFMWGFFSCLIDWNWSFITSLYGRKDTTYFKFHVGMIVWKKDEASSKIARSKRKILLRHYKSYFMRSSEREKTWNFSTFLFNKTYTQNERYLVIKIYFKEAHHHFVTVDLGETSNQRTEIYHVLFIYKVK